GRRAAKNARRGTSAAHDGVAGDAGGGGVAERQTGRSGACQGVTVMADFFIRRPIVAIVISILTVIVGLISLKRLPISEYPPVSPTMIQVTTTYRGAAAEAG